MKNLRLIDHFKILKKKKRIEWLNKKKMHSLDIISIHFLIPSQ